MKPCVFETSVVLDASIQQVYAFHENPYNLLSISPVWLDARIGHASPTAKEGEEFALSVGLRGVPARLNWVGFWEKVLSPDLLVDGARRSPFTYWQHQHRFQALDAARTRMVDHVTYQFPGGWLGKLFGETFGRVQFIVIFRDRQRRTRRWMLEHKEETSPNLSAQ